MASSQNARRGERTRSFLRAEKQTLSSHKFLSSALAPRKRGLTLRAWMYVPRKRTRWFTSGAWVLMKVTAVSTQQRKNVHQPWPLAT